MKVCTLLALLLSLIPFGIESNAAGRFVLSDRTVIVDQLVWVCVARSDPPTVLHIDGDEEPRPTLVRPPAGSQSGRIHLVLDWPERGPLELLSLIDERPRTNSLPGWGNRGYLGPGEYVLSAEGFEPETLHVQSPNADESRTRAALARAWFHCEAGDSAHAAQLVEGVLALDSVSPFRQEAFLILLEVLPHTDYGRSPEAWLSEWVARHHSDCVVGAGLRAWFTHIDEERAIRALREISSGYPRTEAARSAEEWLR